MIKEMMLTNKRTDLNQELKNEKKRYDQRIFFQKKKKKQ